MYRIVWNRQKKMEGGLILLFPNDQREGKGRNCFQRLGVAKCFKSSLGCYLEYLSQTFQLFVIIQMEHHSNQQSKSTLKYSKISLKKRKQLVLQVIEKQALLSKVAKKLNISLSTAKLIVKRYKQDGTFFESKAQRSKREQEIKKAEEDKQNQIIQQPPSTQNTTIAPSKPLGSTLFDASHAYNYQTLMNFPYCWGMGPQNTMMFYYF